MTQSEFSFLIVHLEHVNIVSSSFHLTLSAIGFSLLFSLFLLKVQDSVMHHSAGELVDRLLFLLIEAQDVNGVLLSTSRDVLLTEIDTKHQINKHPLELCISTVK